MSILKQLNEIAEKNDEFLKPYLTIETVNKDLLNGIDKDKNISDNIELRTNNVPQHVIKIIKDTEANLGVKFDFDQPKVERTNDYLTSVKIKARVQNSKTDEYYKFEVENVNLRDAIDIKKALLIYFLRSNRGF